MSRVGRTRSIALVGMSGAVVEVEADIGSQLPAFHLIGLPDAALGEARERVRSACANSGLALPARKLTVNLSPAALPKHGSGFDLAIALTALAACGEVNVDSVAAAVHLGELGLDGRVRPTPGVLPAVLAAAAAGCARVYVPTANVAEASLVSGIEVVPVASLREAAQRHGATLEDEPDPGDDAGAVEGAGARPEVAASIPRENGPEVGDLADIVGNMAAVDALILAAAGGHHLLLLGPPGAGKSMLASRLPGILPDLCAASALDVACVRSLSGEPVAGSLPHRPPFEAPHHTASAIALVGGGSRVIRPGAVSRASGGVLFLDEAPEFSSGVLDALRQPLESGTVVIHRSHAVAEFPAQFQLVLAANPCPCGRWDAQRGDCSCPSLTRRRYLGRMSGPLRDRIDLDVWVPRVSSAMLRYGSAVGGVSTAVARTRVEAARQTAAERLRETPWRTNAQMSGAWLRGKGRLHPGGRATVDLDRALERGELTMRGYDQTLKVAWTAADLDGATSPGADHVGRALTYRSAA